MRKRFNVKLSGDESRRDASAAFTCRSRRRCLGQSEGIRQGDDQWLHLAQHGRNRGGIQYIVVNAEARRSAAVKTGDLVNMGLEPDSERRFARQRE